MAESAIHHVHTLNHVKLDLTGDSRCRISAGFQNLQISLDALSWLKPRGGPESKERKKTKIEVVDRGNPLPWLWHMTSPKINWDQR
jgi:hypothetical protein